MKVELKQIIDEVAHDMIFDAYHNFDREYRQNKLEEAKKLVKEKVEALPDENLMVSVTSSTKTSMGQSFTLMFSTGGQGWCDSTTTFLLAPDDPDFGENPRPGRSQF